MNRRWFFGLLAAAALLPKKAVGKAFRAGHKIPRFTVEYHHYEFDTKADVRALYNSKDAYKKVGGGS